MGKTHQVYVGNDVWKTVTHNPETRYYLDMEKIKELFEENPERELTVGATGDWFFTARTIEGKREFDRIREGECYILRSSPWSKFF